MARAAVVVSTYLSFLPPHQVTAVALLSRLAARCDDEARTGRILPYLVCIVGDAAPLVRAHALCALAGVLEQARWAMGG